MGEKTRKGFTLIELLSVIAIVSVVVGLSLPAIQMVRESARRLSCENNVRQFSLAMCAFESANGRFPPGQLGTRQIGSVLESANPLVGHLGYILPFLEQAAFQSSFSVSDWSIESTEAAWFKNLPSWQASAMGLTNFKCPSDSDEIPQWVSVANVSLNNGSVLALPIDTALEPYSGWTNYVGCSGDVLIGGNYRNDTGIFYVRSKTKTSDVLDGLSHTILIGESIGGIERTIGDHMGSCYRRHGIMTNGIGNQMGYFSGNKFYVVPWWSFSSRHAGKIANFSFADGHVSPIAKSIEPDLLGRLMTRNGGELISSEY